MIARELYESSASIERLESTDGQLAEVFLELSEEYLDRISLTSKSRMQRFRKQKSFDSQEFLEASMFPLCRPSTVQFAFESFFNLKSLSGQSIFINDYEVKDNQVVGVGEDEWSNVSTEPRALVQFIGTLPNQPTGRLLDWGCGSGSTLFVLDRITSMDISGIDKYEKVIRLAKENAILLGSPDIDFNLGDIFTAPVAENDTIFLYAPLRKKPAIREFLSSLKGRVGQKSISIWSKDVASLKKELDAQDWLRKGHAAGGITEYKPV